MCAACGCWCPWPWVTIQPASDGILSQKGSKVIPYTPALLDGQAYMLFLLWVPKWGVPRQCFCHGCPSGEGAARVPMHLHAILVLRLDLRLIDPNRFPKCCCIDPITNWLQPNGCTYQIILPTPLWWWGVLGAVNNVFSLHTDKLSLGCFSAPWLGGVCACLYEESCGFS